MTAGILSGREVATQSKSISMALMIAHSRSEVWKGVGFHSETLCMNERAHHQ